MNNNGSAKGKESVVRKKNKKISSKLLMYILPVVIRVEF